MYFLSLTIDAIVFWEYLCFHEAYKVTVTKIQGLRPPQGTCRDWGSFPALPGKAFFIQDIQICRHWISCSAGLVARVKHGITWAKRKVLCFMFKNYKYYIIDSERKCAERKLKSTAEVSPKESLWDGMSIVLEWKQMLFFTKPGGKKSLHFCSK